jgi:hypothetical protein
MRDNWIKGRRLMFDGKSDIEVAKYLEITLPEWQEIRSACSGPPLELKDQAMPSDPLEPEEFDFKTDYRDQAKKLIEEITQKEKDSLISYFKGDTSKPPMKQFNRVKNQLKNK